MLLNQTVSNLCISPTEPNSMLCVSYDLGKFLCWTVLNVFRESSPMIKKTTFQIGSTCSFCPPEKWNKSAPKVTHVVDCVSFLECGLQEGGRSCSVRVGREYWVFPRRDAPSDVSHGVSPLVPKLWWTLCSYNTFREIINCFSSPNLPKISALASVEEKCYIKF